MGACVGQRRRPIAFWSWTGAVEQYIYKPFTLGPLSALRNGPMDQL